MRIESVTADAFGPLVGETLTLSPGLTVVHGDNESAKSSWHAAIYAALCGRRRGRGASTTDDRDFVARRRPWDGDAWKVRCVVRLDDGRRIDLQHDLDGKVDCRAIDERGRDVSNDIMYEGAPDGSRWLGLNRRTFAATACVNQAELLRVLEAADELQRDLQRAAASAGKDETAAAALAALKDFRKTSVGKDQANSRRPLRRAVVAHQQALSAFTDAERAHRDYLLLTLESEAAQQQARAASTDRQQAEADKQAAERLVQAVQSLAAAHAAAQQATAHALERRERAVSSQARLERARVLSALLPDGEPPSGDADDAVAQQVARAIGAWQSAPEVGQLTGPSSADLQRQIEGLPPAPTGDVAVDPGVERLRDTYLQAVAVLDRSEENRVTVPDVSDPLVAAAVRVDPATLRWLEEGLTSPPADPDARLEMERDAAADRRDAAAAALDAAEQQESAVLEAVRSSAAVRKSTSGPTSRVPVAGVGALLIAIGVGLAFMGHSVAGLLLAATGAAGLAVSARLRQRAATAGESMPANDLDARLEAARLKVREHRDQRMRAEQDYVSANSRLESAEATAAASAARRQAAVAQAAELGLPTDGRELAAVSRHAQHVVSQRESFRRWQREHDTDQRSLQSSANRLAEALADRGYADEVDILQAFRTYEHDCASRQEQTRQARRRDELTRQLNHRKDSERAVARSQQARDAAADEVMRAARAGGLLVADEAAEPPHAVDVDALAEQLSKWLEDRSATLKRADEHRRRWQEYRAVLDGLSLDELAAIVSSDLTLADAAEQAARAAGERLEAATARLEGAAAEAGLEPPVGEREARSLLRSRQEELEQASTRERDLVQWASNQQGKAAERAESIPNVAEAEEAVERAQRELERLRCLDEVLDLTSSFLQEAQERTYTDLAPVLNTTLDKWLPEVTGGRYRRARVNPETLEVLVESEGGSLRRAELLSVGTAEQVYLLLRVALAEHLATKSTVSPLLLDDVTVQSDPTRTTAILRMCKALADDGRQIVVFAQEPSVAVWAEANLDGSTHKLVKLAPSRAA